MTRINIGIRPSELCNAHLLAEYRELPRAINHPPKCKPPERFCLGPGHVAWCAQFQAILRDRHLDITAEMWHRGFWPRICLGEPTAEELQFEGRLMRDRADDARRLLIERINERLLAMKRKPTWTKRSPPEWSVIK